MKDRHDDMPYVDDVPLDGLMLAAVFGACVVLTASVILLILVLLGKL